MKTRLNTSGKTCKILALLLSFLLTFEQSGFAQALPLPAPLVQDTFRPLHLRYLSYDAINNNFKLLLDKGSLKNPKPEELKDTTKQLLNYFSVGLALPSESFWVNLRPDGEDNIIDSELAKTDMGRVMLEADLQLKKDTANSTSPNTPEGKAYWDKLYKKAGELFGSENVTIPTLTRVWIVPDEIILSETQTSAYIYKATLKVLLEQDYLKDSTLYNFTDAKEKALNEYSSQLFRESIIPNLTKEVNASKRYASLRQVYYSLIMAEWFKARFSGKRGSYPDLINTGNLTGLISQEPWSKTTYFRAYQKSANQGEYNIQETVNAPFSAFHQITKQYICGGVLFNFVLASRTVGDRVKVSISDSIIPDLGGMTYKPDTKTIVYSIPSNNVSSAETNKNAIGLEVNATDNPGEIREVRIEGAAHTNEDYSINRFNALVRFLSGLAIKNKNELPTEKQREIEKLERDLQSAIYESTSEYYSESKRVVARRSVEECRKRLAGIMLMSWVREQSSKDIELDKDSLRSALLTMGLPEKQVNALIRKIILVEIPERIRLESRAEDGSRVGGVIISSSEGYRILFPRSRILDEGYLGDLWHEIVEVSLLEEGFMPDKAHKIALQAQDDFRQGKLANLLDVIYKEKTKQQKIAAAKVVKCIEEQKTDLIIDGETRSKLTYDESLVRNRASSWVEGIERAYGTNEGFVDLSNIEFSKIFATSNISEREFDKKKYADFINQKLHAFFGEGAPTLTPEQIVACKSLWGYGEKNIQGKAYRQLRKFVIDEKLLDKESDLEWILIHEALHMLFPGLHSQFLNEAVTDLLTGMILGRTNDSSGYADRVGLLRVIISSNKKIDLSKILIDSYTSGDWSLLRRRVIEIYGEDSLFLILVNLELFEFLGGIVAGYMTPEIMGLIRYRNLLQKQYNEAKFMELQGDRESFNWSLSISLRLYEVDKVIGKLLENKVFYRNRKFAMVDSEINISEAIEPELLVSAMWDKKKELGNAEDRALGAVSNGDLEETETTPGSRQEAERLLDEKIKESQLGRQTEVGATEKMKRTEMIRYIIEHRQSALEVLLNAVRRNDVVTLGEIHNDKAMIGFITDAVALLAKKAGLAVLAWEYQKEHQKAFEIFMQAWMASGEENFEKFVNENIKREVIRSQYGIPIRVEVSPLLKRIAEVLPEGKFIGHLEKTDIMDPDVVTDSPLDIMSCLVGGSASEAFRLFREAYRAGVNVQFVDSRQKFSDADLPIAGNIEEIIVNNPQAKVLFYGGRDHARRAQVIRRVKLPPPPPGVQPLIEGSEQVEKRYPISHYLPSALRVYTIVQDSVRSSNSSPFLERRKSFLELSGLQELEDESFALVDLEASPLADLPFEELEDSPESSLGKIADAIIFHGNNPVQSVPPAAAAPIEGKMETAGMDGIDGSESLPSKPNIARNLGGIDFRNLPLVRKAMGNLKPDLDSSSMDRLKSMNLDTEWQEIENLVSQGTIPSAESIREYIQASCLKGNADKDIDKVISCIADILRLQEERYVSTEPLLQYILIAVESANSVQQLKAAFIGNAS